MNTCTLCGYKQVKNSLFEQHVLTHQVDPVKEEVVPAVESPVEVSTPPVMSDEITLRFTQSVWFSINAKVYEGKEITVKDMSTAAELVRMAREAYGPQILA